MIEILQVIVGLILLAVMGYNLYNQWEMKKLVDGMGLRIRSLERDIIDLSETTEEWGIEKTKEAELCDDLQCSRNNGRVRYNVS